MILLLGQADELEHYLTLLDARSSTLDRLG